MNDDQRPCYETAEQNLFTRFETDQQGTYVLPYTGLLFALLSPPTRGSSGDTLTLLYVTHTVTIQGSQLSSLLTVIQKGRAETIRVGGWQPDGANANTQAVREITVTEGPSHRAYE